MGRFFFLFRQLLGAINEKSGRYLLALVLVIFCFLAIVSSFFLIGSTGVGQSSAPRGRITANLSARLSNDQIQELYIQIRELEEVSRINYLFGEESSPTRVGGVFTIEPSNSAAMGPLVRKLEELQGIEEVISSRRVDQGPFDFSFAWKIGLLIGLVISGFGSLWVGRTAFKQLLSSYARAIRMLRLAGATEKTIQIPIIALGVACGLFAAGLVIFVVLLLHSTHPYSVLQIASNLADPGRVQTVCLFSLFSGLCLGGLAGALGASLTGSRQFRPY